MFRPLYIAAITKPNDSTAEKFLSIRNKKPRENDWSQVNRIIRYLKITKDIIINLQTETIISGFTDVN